MPFGGYAPLPLRLGGTATNGLTAQQHSRMCADLVAVKRTAPLAALTFYDETVFDYYAMNGVGFEIETVPTVDHISNFYVITFSGLWEDELEVAKPINIKHAVFTGMPAGGITPRIYTVVIGVPNVVTVRSFNSAGSAQSIEFATLTVW